MRLRTPIAVLVSLLLAMSASAAKKRAVAPLNEVFFTYSVLDATTAKPVVGAEVTTGSQTVVTGTGGDFTLRIVTGRPVAVTVHRSGYQDIEFTVLIPLREMAPVSGPGPGAIVTLPPTAAPPVAAPVPPASNPAPAPTPVQAYIPLTPRAPVTVKFTTGLQSQLDAETVQFAYVLPFATPEGSNTASFCRADGTAWNPDRGDFAQITGPARKATSTPCCKLGPVLTVDVKMKGGESATVAFTDSCFGYDVVLAGRDRETAQYVYLKFTDIASVTFP